ncbi:single-stranded DNA-binding protein [Bifidobacterium sp. ESL0800]|uniref:single-stranded DNA-binding protein n=1 Tax=Bifidobacterium sp. ESL0800 TaxID=2983236 RepID=UPI0023F90EC9|nr:single-stranded DNA-binding protein [Bifidobacterium sp. ESL0800]WEV75875.1 single-stranded DNA-binding protein [Bifidobacterium sp. ESL0800]
MAQQGTVTISGFMGANPQSFGKEGGPAAASFRIGCTTRYFNPAVNEWRDRPTTWISVKVFRQLAENVLSSLKKGDPVIATGNLATEEWTRDGTKHSRMVMEATSVGHDLSFGISVFQRVKPGAKERGNGHDPFNAEQERAEGAAAEGGELQAQVSAGDQNRASGEDENTQTVSGPAANHAQHDGQSSDDETEDESWDASEVFEGHETADRLVASVG